MKRIVLVAALLLTAFIGRAQKQMAFPFQGGKEAMMNFFRDNVAIPDALKKLKATGTAVLKFTADEKGAIQKIVVYYADDYSIAIPFIDALKKADRKWVIPDEVKTYDFVISFTLNMATSKDKASAATQQQVYETYKKRQPIFASNPVPIDMATLLPAVITTY
jgi:hypothetical protein